MELAPGASDLTRRQALQAGGATAAAAFIVMHPWTSAIASAADSSSAVPKHLLRSTWRDVSNREFIAGNTTLRLESVSDLANTGAVPSFVDSEDAFSLVFSGGGSLPPGIQRVRHSELGTFDLYVGHVGTDDAHEAVVNRVLSNRESRRTPPKPPRPAAAPAEGADAGPPESHTDDRAAPRDTTGEGRKRKPKRVFREVDAKRTKHGAKVVLELAPSADVREVTAWLKREDRIVAVNSRRAGGKRVAMNLKPAKRLRKGLYELDLMATDADGEQSLKRVRVRLR